MPIKIPPFRAVAASHAAADAACGREWVCACGPCRSVRWCRKRAAALLARNGYDARPVEEGYCPCCRRWVSLADDGRMNTHGGGRCQCKAILHSGCMGYVKDGVCRDCGTTVTMKSLPPG